jgi:FAD dependent oxidoreductase TIGR03364
MASYDLVVAGAGIVGLAHALAAARRGLRVAVLERDARAASASVRNFGFITISGQDEDTTRARALRSRDVWEEVATAAGITVHQRGALVVAQRDEAMEVLAQFAASSAGAGCTLLDRSQTRARLAPLRDSVRGALWSPHELRVEAREALPAIARWLAESHGVAFAWSSELQGIDGRVVRHAGGAMEADALVIASGAGVGAFAPALARRIRVRQCKLQMMRLAARGALPGVVMTDLSLLRYGGFAAQPGAGALRARLERECGAELEHGVHLIVAQAKDGSLVVGDSHHYGETADPFASDAVDALILGEYARLFDAHAPRVLERWNGYYPVADVAPVVSEEIGPRVRLVSVTSGTGMSTAFAIGEETVDQLFGTRGSSLGARPSM